MVHFGGWVCACGGLQWYSATMLFVSLGKFNCSLMLAACSQPTMWPICTVCLCTRAVGCEILMLLLWCELHSGGSVCSLSIEREPVATKYCELIVLFAFGSDSHQIEQLISPMSCRWLCLWCGRSASRYVDGVTAHGRISLYVCALCALCMRQPRIQTFKEYYIYVIHQTY